MDRYLGKRLDGRYEIREIIGVGGMAVVYKAFDNVENRFVAIKILKEEFLSNQEFLRRFKNESKAIAMLSHPNIVSVYDVSFGDLIQYIVMEYIEGITLKEFIEREGSLRWKDAVHFAIQILKGLQHAHDRGIVHRDVKPQNIMVLSDGTIKVTDFGIARFARSDQRTITDKAIGSVHYISPEQARGEKTDERADIYSVGVMLYEMLTGKLPFQAESAVSVAIMQLQREPQLPSEINGSIPLGLEQITMHAMQKSPERRYQSASEILCDLTNFRKDPSTTFPYTFFVDDAPTKFVGDISNNDINEDEEHSPKHEKNSLIPILTGVAVAVVAAIVVLCIIFIPKLFASTGDEFKCPNFVGKNFVEVQNDEEYRGKFIFTFEPKASDEYDENIIVEQSIAEGSPLKEDTKITLYYSSGKTLIPVPNVYGYTEAAARTELENINDFNVVIKQEFSDEFEAGIVIKTEPEQGKPVPKGSKIEVYVSSGKEEISVDIPNVIGEPISQAKQKIEDANLKVAVENVNISSVDSYQPKDYVLRQEPQGGSGKVPEGTTVTLYVSSGEYESDIQISLPTQFSDKICSVALYYNGTCIKTSENINLEQAKSYTFKDITSANKNSNYLVMIKGQSGSWQNYMDITVDFTIEKNNVQKLGEYPLATAPTTPEASTENTESVS